MRVFARDVWGKDESGGLVWAILTLCAIITDLGATFHSAHFPAISTSDESCSIRLPNFGVCTHMRAPRSIQHRS